MSALDRAEAMARDFADDWLSSGFIKMFMDGVIDSGTACLLRPSPAGPGAPSLFAQPRFDAICTEIDRRGLQIAVHAIGDGAVRRTLDGFGAARAANGPRDSRHRIEHVELIDSDDIPRLAALGVTASLQPSHVPGALDFPLQPTLDLIGRDRWGDAYLCRTLARAGAALAFASDWPVADASVMRGLQAALTRPSFPGQRDERLGRISALRAFTVDGAWAAHREIFTGRLAAGLAADMVLIDGNIETLPPESLGQTGITMTIAGGKVTHGGPGLG